MVACAAGVSVAAIQLLVGQPIIGSSSGFMQQNSCAIVDQLKQRLQLVIENGDESGTIEVISNLESLTLSKEVLETTRIGLTVNEVRRRTAQNWPDVSRRCRALIKAWQKLADLHRPLSSCGDSSNGGTPSLISPSSRRGITPRTPGGGKRITSTDYKCAAAKNGVSPVNGSYAPRKEKEVADSVSSKESIMHKSASVGGVLCTASSSSPTTMVTSIKAVSSRSGSQHVSPDMLSAGVDAASFNASQKRKAQDAVGKETKIKCSKSARNLAEQQTSGGDVAVFLQSTGITNTGSNGFSSAAAGGGVSVARKDVQSTAELVAQLTGNLPQNMNISLQNNQSEQQLQVGQQKLHQKKISSASVSENGSGIRVVFSTASQEIDSSNTNTAPIASAATLGKAKRKYTKRAAKFFRNASVDSLTDATVANDGNVVLSHDEKEREKDLTNTMMITNSGLETITEESGQADGGERFDVAESSSAAKLTNFSKVSSLANYWQTRMPTLSALQSCKPEYATPITDATASSVLTIRRRHVLALPYCEIGEPDFLEYSYPEPDRFIEKDGPLLPHYRLSK